MMFWSIYMAVPQRLQCSKSDIWLIWYNINVFEEVSGFPAGNNCSKAATLLFREFITAPTERQGCFVTMMQILRHYKVVPRRSYCFKGATRLFRNNVTVSESLHGSTVTLLNFCEFSKLHVWFCSVPVFMVSQITSRSGSVSFRV